MDGEGRLRFIDPPLADLIRNAADEASLREFACSCAEFALQVTGLDDERLKMALVVAAKMETETIPDEEIERMRSVVSEIAARLDDVAFDRQDEMEAGEASKEDYMAAFSLARAAQSVRECLIRPARKAAGEACYEALAAQDDLDSLLTRAQKILR